VRAFWLLVLVPLAMAGYLAVRVSSEGAELRRHEVQGLLDGRLADVRTRASQAFAALERQLDEQLAAAPAPAPAGEQAEDRAEALRAIGRRMPLARQVFRVDAKGRLTFPVSGGDASRAEREFLERTASIWSGRAILQGDAKDREPPAAAQRRRVPGMGDSLVDLAAQQEHGWLAWYWEEGLHLLFWRRAVDGGVIGVEVERVGVLARIVGALPTSALEDGRMELADSRGQTVHQWGPMVPAEGAVVAGAVAAGADASIALDPPLDAWQLRYYISSAQRAALSGGVDSGLFLGMGAIGLALLGLAVYIYREYTRRLRDAAMRVGFVTRVSHELRTPLTNIRMYAELLEDALSGGGGGGDGGGGDGGGGDGEHDGSDDEQVRRARVIVAESQRLGRLIENVLAFARHQRGVLEVKPARVDVDAVVREVVATFEPALAARGIEVRFALGDPPPARASTDAVDQIVANLLSNVERYAAAGGEVVVGTRAANGCVVVSVADRGPGVPAREREAIFEPFHRVGDSLTGGSGTGIGLAIARELARAVGGELVLAEAERGACFELTLPVAEDGGPP
jgi:signal transduction histidine kinase